MARLLQIIPEKRTKTLMQTFASQRKCEYATVLSVASQKPQLGRRALFDMAAALTMILRPDRVDG